MNLLLPKEIVQVLFKLWRSETNNIDVAGKENILLSIKKNEYQNTIYNKPPDLICDSKKLALVSHELRNSIAKWLKKFGAEEINFSHMDKNSYFNP